MVVATKVIASRCPTVKVNLVFDKAQMLMPQAAVKDQCLQEHPLVDTRVTRLVEASISLDMLSRRARVIVSLSMPEVKPPALVPPGADLINSGVKAQDGSSLVKDLGVPIPPPDMPEEEVVMWARVPDLGWDWRAREGEGMFARL